MIDLTLQIKFKTQTYNFCSYVNSKLFFQVELNKKSLKIFKIGEGYKPTGDGRMMNTQLTGTLTNQLYAKDKCPGTHTVENEAP